MPTEAPIVNACFADAVDTVKVSAKDEVGDVKVFIHEKHKNRLLCDVDARDLTLWKVSRSYTPLQMLTMSWHWQLDTPIDIMPESTLAVCIQSLGTDTSQFAQKLEDFTESFATLFPALPEDQIHIMVMLPTAPCSVGECS